MLLHVLGLVFGQMLMFQFHEKSPQLIFRCFEADVAAFTELYKLATSETVIDSREALEVPPIVKQANQLVLKRLNHGWNFDELKTVALSKVTKAQARLPQ